MARVSVMTRRKSARIAASCWLLGAFGAAACAKDPKVEDETPPGTGIQQPGPSGSESLSLDEACSQIVEAENEARDRLNCEGAAAECPGHLRVAGALPCDEINRASVEACVDAIGEYGACADFSRHPCIVTVDPESCRSPELPEGGTDASDAASDAMAEGGPEDASMDADATPPEASPLEGGPADGSLSEAGLTDAPAD
jgi:hypothetical protein